MAHERGALQIGGSWTGYLAHIRLAEQFTRDRGVPTDVQGRNNARGFEYLRDRELDVLIYSPVYGVPQADAVRNVFPDENAQPKEYHFGRFAVLVVVHHRRRPPVHAPGRARRRSRPARRRRNDLLRKCRP